MKRKLVNYVEFEKMKENSLSTTVNELIEAQDHLARTIGVESLVLESFDDSKVIYQKNDGTFLSSQYEVESDAITFNNIEELVIDEASETSKRREVVGNLLTAILEDKDVEASNFFSKYMELASQKHKREGTLLPKEEGDAALEENHVRLYGTRGHAGPKVFVRKGAKDPKKAAAAKKGHRLHAAAYKAGGKKRKSHITSERSRRRVNSQSYSRLHSLSGGKQYGRKKHLNEWLTLTENVFQYADIMENGYVLSESVTRQDEKGNLTSVRIPNTKARNEAKIIKMHYDKMIKQDSPKVMRENGLRLAQDLNFGKAIVDLKRHNNVFDTEALETSLGKVVQSFPSVLFLTQSELAKTIGTALENAGVVNFDDNTCIFMAEGILRTAHHVYSERVEKMFGFANAKVPTDSKDEFVEFQKAMDGYFPTLDESIATEMKVYEDLYNAVLDVRKIALESRNDEIRSDANDIISELELVLNRKTPGSVDFAVEVADWLRDVVEANLPGASDTWTVVKTPHDTVSGDHPQMATNAKVDGIAGKYPGDWDDPAPQISQEKMKYSHANAEEARNRSWGNKGGKDVWPDLSNPNVPKPYGDYTMKGAESVPDDDQWGNGSGDTWPSLQNPYVPKSLIPKQLVDPKNPVE